MLTFLKPGYFELLRCGGGGGGGGGGGNFSVKDPNTGKTLASGLSEKEALDMAADINSGRGYDTTDVSYADGSSSSFNNADYGSAPQTDYSGLSFSKAFSKARSALGPGSEFTWNGNTYSTATAEERPDLAGTPKAADPTAGMTPAQRDYYEKLVAAGYEDQNALDLLAQGNTYLGVTPYEPTPQDIVKAGEYGTTSTYQPPSEVYDYTDYDEETKIGTLPADYVQRAEDQPLSGSDELADLGALNASRGIPGVTGYMTVEYGGDKFDVYNVGGEYRVFDAGRTTELDPQSVGEEALFEQVVGQYARDVTVGNLAPSVVRVPAGRFGAYQEYEVYQVDNPQGQPQFVVYDSNGNLVSSTTGRYAEVMGQLDADRAALVQDVELTSDLEALAGRQLSSPGEFLATAYIAMGDDILGLLGAQPPAQAGQSYFDQAYDKLLSMLDGNPGLQAQLESLVSDRAATGAYPEAQAAVQALGTLGPSDSGLVEVSLDRLEDLASYARDLQSQMGGYSVEDLEAAGFTPEEINVYEGSIAPKGLTSQDIKEMRDQYGDYTGTIFIDPLVDTFGVELGSLIRASGGMFTEMTGNLFTQFGDAYNYLSGGDIGAENFMTRAGEMSVEAGREIQERGLEFLAKNDPEAYEAFTSPIIGEDGVNWDALRTKAVYSSIPTVVGLAGIPFGVIPATVVGGLATAAELGTEARNEAYEESLARWAEAKGITVAEARRDPAAIEQAEAFGRSANLLAGALGAPVGAVTSGLLQKFMAPGVGPSAIANIAAGALLAAADEGFIEQTSIATSVNMLFDGVELADIEPRVSVDEGILGALTGGAVTAASYAKAKVAGLSDQQISDQIKNTPEGQVVEFTAPDGTTIQGGTVPYSSIMSSGNPIEVRTNAEGVSQVVDTVTGATSDIPAGTEITFGEVPTGTETTIQDLLEREASVAGGGPDVRIIPNSTTKEVTFINDETGFEISIPQDSIGTDIENVVFAVQNNDSGTLESLGATVTSDLIGIEDYASTILSELPADASPAEIATVINRYLDGSYLSLPQIEQVMADVVGSFEGLTEADLLTIFQDGLSTTLETATDAQIQEVVNNTFDRIGGVFGDLTAQPPKTSPVISDKGGYTVDVRSPGQPTQDFQDPRGQTYTFVAEDSQGNRFGLSSTDRTLVDLATGEVVYANNEGSMNISEVYENYIGGPTGTDFTDIVTAADIQGIVDTAMETQAADFTSIVEEALGALPINPTLAEITTAINNSIGNLNDLSAEEVTSIVSDYVGSLENLSAEEVTSIVQGIVDNQTVVTVDQIQNIADKVTLQSQVDLGELELSIMERINELESQNVDRARAVNIALTEAATQLNTTESTILDSLNTTEENLTETLTDISTQVTDVGTQVTEGVDQLLTTFDTRVNELVEQGTTIENAIDTAVTELATELNTTNTTLTSILTILDDEFGPKPDEEAETDTSDIPTDVLPGTGGVSPTTPTGGAVQPTVAPYYQPQQVGLPSLYTPIPGVEQQPQQGYIMPALSYLAPTSAPQYGYGFIAPNMEGEYLRPLAETQGTGAERIYPEG